MSAIIWYLSKDFLKNLLIKRQTDWYINPFFLFVLFYNGPSLYLFHRPNGIVSGKFSLWAKATGRGGANTGNIWELVCLLMWKGHSSSTSFRFHFQLQLRKKKMAGIGPKRNSTKERHSNISIFLWLFINLSPLWPWFHHSQSLRSAAHSFESCSLITWVFIFIVCLIKCWAQC